MLSLPQLCRQRLPCVQGEKKSGQPWDAAWQTTLWLPSKAPAFHWRDSLLSHEGCAYSLLNQKAALVAFTCSPAWG